ncbi:Serine hydroxymethyltransferase [Operophtera brumata]|uniref:Serine hydroxymethyltransferase n=1 Tax=Operophtera brumata TaxID=104452 RepID=A0A0L7L0C0_OPEBR|nr:Serine hydroxymethyltransferase [Operophtera brumata]
MVTTTTHKTLRGPRAGIIFYRKGVRSVKANGQRVMYELEGKINQAVIKNAQRLCAGLTSRGYAIATGGTDVHLALVDMRSKGLTGAPAERVLELCSIACNKNTVPGDKSALNPSGIRLVLSCEERVLELCSIACNKNTVPGDKSALNPSGIRLGKTRCCAVIVVDFIDKALQLGQEITKVSGPKVADFNKVIGENADFKSKIAKLKEEVENFSQAFHLPGFEKY